MKETLIKQAVQTMKHSYSPYSKFPVGAALATPNGVYTGVNVENAAYGSSCCAERVAIFTAVAAGERSFSGLAVAANTIRPVPPCGACRQVMSEFFDPAMPIYLINEQEEVTIHSMEELLPLSFSSSDLTD